MINHEQIVFKEGKMDLKKIFGAFGAVVLLLATLASVFAAVPYVKTVEDFQSDIEDLTIEHSQLKADFEEAKADFNKKGDTTDLKKTIGFLKKTDSGYFFSPAVFKNNFQVIAFAAELPHRRRRNISQ